MVAISTPPKVLVTGANGYFATWVVKKYLEAGYSVRGTVRSLSKSAFLNDKFARYGDRFELVVVEDITKDGAFDEAVKNIDAIAHTAFPFYYKDTDPEGLSDFLWILILFGNQDVYRSHRPCCASNHVDTEFCIETWEFSEAFSPHFLCLGGLGSQHRAAHFQ